MKPRHLLALCLTTLLFFMSKPALAQTTNPGKQEYIKGTVVKVESEGKRKMNNIENIYQTLRIKLLEGAEQNEEIVIEHGGMFTITEAQKVKAGDTIVLSRTVNPKGKGPMYAFVDIYRLDLLPYLLGGFALFVILLAGRHGIGALIGNAISIMVIFAFIVPQILSGADPLLISIIGSIIILMTTIFLAHGLSQRTLVAIGSTIVSLFLTGLFAVLFVKLVNLSGLGSEDAYSLQQGFKDTINFQGLLLGGIIIGALGVLDDVTTTQTTTVYTLAEANQKYTLQDLFTKGMIVGREHIASLVNTLVLAYAGASIGVFIFLHLGLRTQPLWVMLNSELIVEEIIRTLAGSIGLILAVPITTLLAAFFSRYSLRIR